MTGNPEVMDHVGRRGAEGGNAERRLLCMPVGCSTASPRGQRKQLNGGAQRNELCYVKFSINSRMFYR